MSSPQTSTQRRGRRLGLVSPLGSEEGMLGTQGLSPGCLVQPPTLGDLGKFPGPLASGSVWPMGRFSRHAEAKQ